MFKVIFFDTDGVLVESDRLHYQAFNRVLTRHGKPEITWERYVEEGFIAYNDREFFSEYIKSVDAPPSQSDISKFIAEKDAAMQEVLQNNDVSLYPYVMEVIEHLHEVRKLTGLMLGEVTGATEADRKRYFRGSARASLATGWDVVITADDNLRAKPKPDMYLEALNRLNSDKGTTIKASECLVIEDSDGGQRAAHDAGMFVIGITNTSPASSLPVADVLVSTLKPELFDRLLQIAPENATRMRTLKALASLGVLPEVVNVGSPDDPLFLRTDKWDFKNALTADSAMSLTDAELSDITANCA